MEREIRNGVFSVCYNYLSEHEREYLNDSIYPNVSVARRRSFSVSCLSWILSGEPSAIALEHVLVCKVPFLFRVLSLLCSVVVCEPGARWDESERA